METVKRVSGTGKDGVYLTKRLLIRLSKKAIQKATTESMDRMGYVVIAQDGWIVKKLSDGTIERLNELHDTNIPLQLD